MMVRWLALLTALVPTSLPADDLVDALRAIKPNVLVVGDEEERRELTRVPWDDVRERRRAANLADVDAWRKITTREDWERFRDERIARLRASLGTFPDPPRDLNVRVTRTIAGDGFLIRNLVFESRPGLHVTANLYEPNVPDDVPPRSRPGILICHSHHRPKTQGELQDMGMTWARAGCVVLVMDQLGHGERRAHPFATAADYPGEFRTSRQDYHFRYNTGMQLHLLGDSLIGWMAWDLMRGVDLLLAREDVDPQRIALLGAVAGGGDPAAVTAALDRRIAAVVPFNFGGPQPETVHPLPEDAELAFNYFGGGSWESTRNLRRSIGDGFPHWLIVASVAPRRLIHAHEFAWDEARDPVWRRYQRVWGEFYERPGHLAAAHGRGSVKGRPPESTHCTNIGPVHRSQIHPRFRGWFGIEATEYQKRLDESDVHVLPGSKESIAPLHEVAGRIADERIAAARTALPDDGDARRDALRRSWVEVLGDVTPEGSVKASAANVLANAGPIRVEPLTVTVERNVRIPVLVLSPPDGPKRQPNVVCVAHSGKAAFLRERRDVIETFLRAGFNVCLPDLRATGELAPGSYRGRRSDGTGLSSNELMFAETTVGGRLRDLRSVLKVLRKRPESDGRFAIWGDSFAEVNGPDDRIAYPLGIDDEAAIAEPLGHLLALLGGLYEPDVEAIVSARGGLTSFRSTLDSEFVHLPHDVIVPGAIEAGDLAPITEWLGDRARIAGTVDARNQPAGRPAVPPTELADWLVERLKRTR